MTESGARVLTEIIDIDGTGHYASITVDNVARLNVVGTPLLRQLADAIRSVQMDTSLRAVVLTGAGDRAFSSGADIQELITLNPASAYPFITQLHLACAAVRKCPVPVIARINGYCLGGGLEIAISCDLRVASEVATFGMPEVTLGIPTAIEAALLPRLVGPAKARELVYTGESITAAEALGCGLVNKVVPAEELDAAVDAWTRAIAKAGSRAVRLQKTLVRSWEELPLTHAIQVGMHSFITAFTDDEPRRMMQRFIDRKRHDPET